MAAGRTKVTEVAPLPLTTRRRQPGRPWTWLGWVLPLVVQLVHAVVVAPHYHVGSFDDDGNYLMIAHVLASGGGLGSRLASGSFVAANYLPGYPLLLVPVVWVFGGSLLAPRVLSAVCVAALYPLTWLWAGRTGLAPQLRAALLALMALNEVLATYSTMVMAEAPFLVALVLGLLAVDAWERRPGWRPAAASMAVLAYAVWLKEAGAGLLVGLGLYWVWRRRWGRLLWTAVGSALLIGPGEVARLMSGGTLLGNRYTGEITNPGGSFPGALPSEVVDNIWSYVGGVLRSSVLPAGNPLASGGPVHWLVVTAGVSVPLLCALGAVVRYRRRPAAETWMVAAYFIETLAYPYNNQRRVILVLPVVTLWYVVGVHAAWCWVWRAASRGARQATRRGVVAVAGVAGALAATVGPSVPGFSANYLFGAHLQSSRFVGAPAITMLSALGSAASVVETDYRGSVAYFTGHRTAWSAFTSTTGVGPTAPENTANCTVQDVAPRLRADRASFLLVGDLNFPGYIDNPCLLGLASERTTATAIGAVRLLASNVDQDSVFELVGPASAQPGLLDRTTGTRPTTGAGVPSQVVRLPGNGSGDHGFDAYSVQPRGGRASAVWRFARPGVVTQLSLGLASATAPVSSTELSLEVSPGRWVTVAAAPGAVGPGGAEPYLLARPGRSALAARVSVSTTGPVTIGLLQAIGPRG